MNAVSHQDPRAHGHGRAGFCLCDLLVVLAVAFLASAFLLPALAKSRQSARGLDQHYRLQQAISPRNNRAGADVIRSIQGRDFFGRSGAAAEMDECLLVYAKAEDRYAAIAYSFKTKKQGYGFNYHSREEAENAALRGCQAADCEVIVWTRNGCCALAVGADDGYGFSWEYQLEAAKTHALSECQKRTKNCQVISWTCTNR